MENKSCSPSSWPAIIYSALSTPRPARPSNPVVSNSLKIWNQIRRHFKWQECSILTPLTANHSFLPSQIDPIFQTWFKKGIRSFQNLFINKCFPTFQQLQQIFDLPSSHFFKYLQARSFVQKNFSSFPNEPSTSQMDTLFLQNPFIKGGISIIYHKLSQLEGDVSLEHVRAAWQEDLELDIADWQWEEAQERVHSSSLCIRHGLIQFKILHRLHLSKLKLSKMFSSVDPLCDRCSQTPASLGHMFWKCPNIRNYWISVFQLLSEVLGKPLDPDPIMAIFGVNSDNVKLSKKQCMVLGAVTLLARRLILLNWKQKNPPSCSALIRDVMHHLQLEKIRFSLKSRTDHFYAVWPFINYFNKTAIIEP